MKKKTLIPLTVAAVAAMVMGVNNVNAKTMTTQEVIDNYTDKIGTNNTDLYIIGAHVFEYSLDGKDIYKGALTVQKNSDGTAQEPVWYHLNTDGSWTNAYEVIDDEGNEAAITAPASFDLDKARLSDGSIVDLSDPAQVAELDKLVAEVSALKMEEYTTDSYKAVSNALAMTSDGSTAQVRAKIEALNSAKNGLIYANRAELDKLIADTDNLKEKEGDYTAASYSAFDTAYKNAKLMSENTYENINKKIDKIKECVKGLKIDKDTAVATAAKADFDAELAKHYTDKYVNNVNDYTSATWKPYYEAVEAAKKLNDASISEYKAATSALQNTYKALVLANKETFEKKLNDAKALDYNLYTASSSKALKTAIENAEKVSATASNGDLDDHITALNNGTKALIKKTSEKALSDAIVAADAKLASKDDFTTETGNALETAAQTNTSSIVDKVASTNSYVIKESATIATAEKTAEEIITEHINNINKALSELKLDGLEAFEKLLKEANGFNPGDYDDNAWAEFISERKTVNDKYNQGFSTKADVSQYKTYLDNAVNKLKTKANTVSTDLVTKLMTLVNELKTLEKSKADYTVDSWKNYDEAVKVGGALIENSTIKAGVTTSQVTTATSNIETTKAALLFDKDNLIYAIDNALKVKESAEYKYYNDNTKSLFEEALRVAIDTRDNSNDKSAIDKAITNLNSIEFVVDKTVLKGVLDEIGTPTNTVVDGKATFTTKSFDDYNSAVNTAKGVYDNNNATSKDVVDAIKAINDTKASLIHLSVEEDLVAAIAAATDDAEFTDAKYNSLEELTTAKAAASNLVTDSKIAKKTTEDKVEKIISELNNALDNLVPTNINELAALKAEMQNIISKNVQEKIYTDASIEELKKALASGSEKKHSDIAAKITAIEKVALVDANSAELTKLLEQADEIITTNQYDTTNIIEAKKLNDTTHEEIVAKVTALKDAIAKDTKEFKNVKDLNAFTKLNDSNLFTADSWTKFVTAYNKIIAVGDATTYAGVNAMITKADEAAAELQNIAKVELKKLYDDEVAKDRKQTDYSAGWDNYVTKKTAADTLLNTTLKDVKDYKISTAQLEAITKATEDLKAAKAGLVKKTA